MGRHTLQLAHTEGELAQQQLQQGSLIVQVAGGGMHVLLASLQQGSPGGPPGSSRCDPPTLGCLLYQRLTLCQCGVLC